jgi:predicted house-cleaning noncanonical NTP pyrophosphatase (MazG superfamily)
MRVAYNKLIRDRIPQIIEAGGHHPVTHVLDEDSYHAALLAKLVEEAQEASSAAADELPSELVDVVEVLQALAVTVKITWDELLSLAADKRSQRGGFEQRLFLEYVEEAEAGPGSVTGP